MAVTRRHVLATTAALAAAGATGVGGAALRWWDRPVDADLRALAADEHAFVQALAEAWMPRGGEPQLSGADARIGDFVDDLVAALDPMPARLLRALLQILDDLPLATRFSTYRALPLDDRIEVLRAWLEHPSQYVRLGAVGALQLVSLGWTRHPEVAAQLAPSFGCGYGR